MAVFLCFQIQFVFLYFAAQGYTVVPGVRVCVSDLPIRQVLSLVCDSSRGV